jgi:hypothetical protein
VEPPSSSDDLPPPPVDEPAPRFDPHTGKPLQEEATQPKARFDPYTGKPLDGKESRMPSRNVLIGAAAVLVVLVAAAIYGLTRSGGDFGGTPAGGHQLNITLDLYNPSDVSIDRFSKGCDVSDTGYDDLTAGAPVTVKDQAGTVLASTFLTDGTESGSDCNFGVSVTVPDADFYQVEIGHRGAVTFSKSELETDGWVAALSIGS